MMNRRVEIIAFERQRVVMRSESMTCPVCLNKTEMLTTRQAGSLFQVKPTSIRRWLVQGKAHGIKTPGGHHRVCKNSLLIHRLDFAAAQIPFARYTKTKETGYDLPQ